MFSIDVFSLRMIKYICIAWKHIKTCFLPPPLSVLIFC